MNLENSKVVIGGSGFIIYISGILKKHIEVGGVA